MTSYGSIPHSKHLKKRHPILDLDRTNIEQNDGTDVDLKVGGGRKGFRGKFLVGILACTTLSLGVIIPKNKINFVRVTSSNGASLDAKKNFDDERLQREKFEEFKILHRKEYSETEENDSRFEAFKFNLELIEELNEANPNAVFGINQFTDMTASDVVSRRMSTDYSNYETLKASLPKEVLDFKIDPTTMKIVTAKTSGKKIKESQFGWVSEDDCSACLRFPELTQYSLENIPDQWDWRDYYETPVRDQGYCGSCWSFSTAGDIEGKWFLATGNAVQLSKQQLIDCDQKRGAAEGCNGGFPQAAMQYVVKTGGLVYDEDYPYHSICDRNCPKTALKAPTCDTETITESLVSSRVAHIGGWQMVALGPDFEDLMALALLKNGPISIALNASLMEHYTKGIMESVKHCDPAELNHAVLLVGYGVENGVKYWTIKNSWGSNWGENGYVRVKRGINYCGVANFAVTSVVKGA
mmetsp:Transcript_19385/g.28691  ORF Transcript_19385/g.28691 Transcript_19385/m.28691 type:complete len:468 (-) Transcript_19385:156-1559(-)